MIIVEKAEHVSAYKIRLQFSDSTCAVVDLENDLDGEVFTPLKKMSYFKKFKLIKELGTISWPNGADFAPEFLYLLSLKQNSLKKKFKHSARKPSKRKSRAK